MSNNDIKNKMIFILSCDENNISNALNKEKRALNLNSEERKSYLDRIFQFRIEIPFVETENLLILAKKIILELEKK